MEVRVLRAGELKDLIGTVTLARSGYYQVRPSPMPMHTHATPHPAPAAGAGGAGRRENNNEEVAYVQCAHVIRPMCFFLSAERFFALFLKIVRGL